MKCEYCGTEFEPNAPHQRYCSKQCNNKAYNKRCRTRKPYKKTCEYCGTEFETGVANQRFCSLKCRQKHYNERRPKAEPVERQCLNCGKVFSVKSAHGSHKKFCSPKCRDHHNYKPAPQVVKTCPYCGKSFETNRADKKYCSRACTRAAYILTHDGTVTKTCAYCNGEFTTRDPKKIYCSAQCRRSAEILNARLQREAKREAVRLAAQNKPAVVKPIETPEPPKVIIPAAAAENRKPTVDELLDWIFSKGATA